MRDLSVYSLRRQRDLLEKKASSQSDFDTAEATQRQAEANVAAAKAAIARKIPRAPFTGKLGIRLVNLGQYLNSGDKIVSLQALDPIRVNFNLPQQYRDTVQVGADVEVRTDATGDRVFKGKINAMDPLVDTATRNFQIQATMAKPVVQDLARGQGDEQRHEGPALPRQAGFQGSDAAVRENRCHARRLGGDPLRPQTRRRGDYFRGVQVDQRCASQHQQFGQTRRQRRAQPGG